MKTEQSAMRPKTQRERRKNIHSRHKNKNKSYSQGGRKGKNLRAQNLKV